MQIAIGIIVVSDCKGMGNDFSKILALLAALPPSREASED